MRYPLSWILDLTVLTGLLMSMALDGRALGSGLLTQRLNLQSTCLPGPVASSDIIITNSSETTNVGSSLQTVNMLFKGPMRPR